VARGYPIVQIIPLLIITAFFALGVLGTVGKLLFDDWQVRRSMKLPVPVVPLPEEPANPAGR